MSRFKIGGEDILVGWRNELQSVYRVKGLRYAKDYLDSIIRYINEKSEFFGEELLPALMRLMIVQKILKEANDDNGTREPVGGSYGRA